MKKKSIFLSLVVVLVLVLSACTTSAPTEAPAEDEPVAEETEAMAEEEMEETEAVAEEEEMEETEEAASDEEEPVYDFDPSVAADEAYNIAIVVKNFQSAFWAQHVDGAELAAEELGINLTSHAPEKPENIEEQIAILEDLITKGVDCIALAPTNTESIAAGIVKLNEAGIPVVYDNTRGSGGDFLAYVGIDNFTVGQQIGEYVAEQMGYEGNLLLLEGVIGQSTSDLRSNGMRDVLSQYPDITVESQPANWSYAEASDITTNMLTKWGGELDAVISAGAGMSEGAAEAIKAYGLAQDDVVVGSFDVTAEVVEAIRNGDVDFTIDQQPFWQAYYSVAACVQYLNGADVPQEIRTPVAIVTLDNLAEHWTD
jgi:ribose transport system substrate-binding protein